MKRVVIEYKDSKVEFKAKEVFYKTEFGWLKEIGYLPEGKRQRKWYPIGGYRDENNDYTAVQLTIEEVER